ncbi:PilZ domain-containing protein [Candidatus Omnitrophota bacterium]
MPCKVKSIKGLEFMIKLVYIFSMIWEGINQRKFPRVSYKCRIRVSRGGRKESIDTLTENIGAGGICVVLEKDFDLFEVVSLELFLGDGGDPIICNGTIVWVVKQHPVSQAEKVIYDTGVEFQDISEEVRERVSRLVSKILGD